MCSINNNLNVLLEHNKPIKHNSKTINFLFQVVNGEIKGLPKAKEMLELQWDNSLEEEAQRYK